MDELRRAARDHLRSVGAVSLPELASFLEGEGFKLASDLDALENHLLPETQVEWEPTELHDGRLVDEEAALDGIVLTTRLTQQDVELGAPAVSPDLEHLTLLLYDGRSLPLASGGELQLELTDETLEWTIDAPAGWMPGEPGQFLVVRLVDGVLHLEAVDDTDLADDLDLDLADRLAEVHDDIRADMFGCELSQLILEVRVRHPDSWTRPAPPLGDLVEDAGLALHGDWVVYPDELDEHGNLVRGGSVFTELLTHLVEDHGMTDEQADDFVVLRIATLGLRISPPPDLDDWERGVINLARAFAGDDPIDPIDPIDPDLVDDEEYLDLQQGLARLTGILADDAIAEAVPHDLLTDAPDLAGPLAVITRRVATQAKDRFARSNAWYLHAHALEFLDEDGITTERALRQALQASNDHTGAAADLAWHLDDRGQAGAALGALVEHGLGDTTWADELRERAAPGPTSAGRNDPCPCGSGRKHKACCGPRNGWPLIDRVDWVFGKLTRFAARPATLPISGVVAVMAGVDPTTIRGLPYEDPVAASLCLFEGGVIGDMCGMRGPLLPADELDLLRQWEQVTAGVYELVDVDRGASLTLLDLRTGDRHEVVERTASQNLQVGTVLLTWLVPYPDGTTRIALGAAPIPVHLRAGLLDLLDREPEVEDLAVWYAALSAPPTLHNTDGDPLLQCEVTVAVPSIDAAVTGLAAAKELEPEDEEDEGGEPPEVFLRMDARDDGRTLLGTVRVEGDQLVLEANSDRRADELVALVRGAVDGAEVVDDVRTSMADLLADRDLAGVEFELGPETPSGALDLDAMDLDEDERRAIRQAADAWIRDAEERWCDESIPALDGLTPREAAADPTRRGDLIALLDSMPAPGNLPSGGGGFDPDRLREHLGLV